MTDADLPPYKKLYRCRQDRKIAGICGGLGVYFRVDPFLMRLIFILFFVAGGAAFLVYIIMWFLVPLEPENTSSTSKKIDKTNSE